MCFKYASCIHIPYHIYIKRWGLNNRIDQINQIIELCCRDLFADTLSCTKNHAVCGKRRAVPKSCSICCLCRKNTRTNIALNNIEENTCNAIITNSLSSIIHAYSWPQTRNTKTIFPYQSKKAYQSDIKT